MFGCSFNRPAMCSHSRTKRVWMPTPPGPASSRQNAANEPSEPEASVAHAGAPSPPVDSLQLSWCMSTSVRMP
jgi:hypothetical protein